MSNHNHQYSNSGLGGHGGPRLSQRHSGDFRAQVPGANGNAPVPVPTGAHRGMNGNGVRGGPGFDGPRSPPNNKSTSHVPCKFFRQGACQAGKACPFLHSSDPTTEITVCKYFAKGNCKFGAKCALAHILPDGRRVNRPPYMGGGLNLGGRMNVPTNEPMHGNSLLSMQMPGPQQLPSFGNPDEYFQAQQQRTNLEGIPTIDTTFSSHPGSNYGSPPSENRLGVSPIQGKGLSAIDAPMPASWDSQGISHYARYGPMGKSVPSRFGLDSSPPSSLPKAVGDSDALRNLHNSAFGDANTAVKNGFGSSPPQREELGARRMLHSERPIRSNLISSSFDPRGLHRGLGDDWDENDNDFAFEGDHPEDHLPTSLNELLTDQEKIRRFSRNEEENPFRQTLSGLGTPTDSKVGSPKVGSPSRFSALFAARAKNEGGDAASPGGSVFGHVGSPLRNASLHPGASPSLRAVRHPSSGDVSPFVSSPPRHPGSSMISQQLQRTRLSTRATSASNINDLEQATNSLSLHPGMARATSGSSVNSATGRNSLDRAVSSTSIRSDRIDEEQGLFSMEDEEEMERRRLGDANPGGLSAITPTSGSNKRFSGGWGAFSGLGQAKKDLNTIGTSPGSQSGSVSSTSGAPGPIGGHRRAESKETGWSGS